MRRKKCLLFIMAGCVFLSLIAGEIRAAADDEDFPNQTIELYVGWAAGGGTANMARAVAQRAGEMFKIQMVMIPKPGVAGTIANDFILRSKPNGYTLTVATSANNCTAMIIGQAKYKVEDFDYLGMFAHNPMILYVSESSPWKSLEEFIAYARDNPGAIKFPSSGVTSSGHIGMEMLNKVAKIKMVHIPMKSDAEMLSSILGAHTQAALSWMTGVMPIREGGKVKFLAAAAENRLKLFPNIPTFYEKGYPAMVLNPWYGIAGPKGMPPKVSGKLKEIFSKIFQDKQFHQMLENLGVDPTFKSAEEFTRYVIDENVKFRHIFQELGLAK